MRRSIICRGFAVTQCAELRFHFQAMWLKRSLFNGTEKGNLVPVYKNGYKRYMKYYHPVRYNNN